MRKVFVVVFLSLSLFLYCQDATTDLTDTTKDPKETYTRRKSPTIVDIDYVPKEK